MPSEPRPVFTVQVRELVEFSLRRGDLGGGRDFVGRDRALAGTRGHQKVQRSRPAGYQKEVPVTFDLETEELILRIQGRIDGLLTDGDGVLLEEIKTVRGGWDGAADPLHWAQAQIYGFIHARQNELQTLTLRLTYLNLESGATTEFHQTTSFAELEIFFQEATAIYLDWITERQHWCRLRDETIRAMEFPFPRYRPGQRELAVAAYKAIERGTRLFLEAPTGIGKTISALFPSLKAMSEGKAERIFYLTARTSGRALAEKAFADMRAVGLRARTLTLTAKEKLCVQQGQPCDPLTCPLAIGYYDRHKAAVRAALNREEITRPVLEEIGREHQVCPFELSLDVSTWVDAIVCDYNYVFDPQVYLRRYFDERSGDHVFLVDEAHNLVDRARDMFSADLSRREIQDVRRRFGKALPRCGRALSRLNTALRKLGGGSAHPEPADQSELEADLFSQNVVTARTGLATENEPPAFTEQRDGILSSPKFPDDLLPLIDTALEAAEQWLARNEPAEFRADLLELYFRLLSFRRTAALFDERFVTLVEPGAAGRVRLFCTDPSILLRDAMTRGKATLFFSATLTPMDYYRTLLGGEPEDRVLQLPSPFDSDQLAILVQDQISTHFKARSESLEQVVQAISGLVRGRRGNYLVYLPSYQYLTAVQERFHASHPDIPVLVQQPGMSEPEREAFLAAFAVEHGETLVGFAVLGGVFGEGIDLVGEKLIGAAIVGVGLPQLCAERDLIRDHFEQTAGAGFDYAYTFPGMNRVLQAIGRVIRSETDRGVALLIDSRFKERRYQRLFPKWWNARRVRDATELSEAVRAFWYR